MHASKNFIYYFMYSILGDLMKKKMIVGIVILAVIAMNFAIIGGMWQSGTKGPALPVYIFPKANHGPIRINSDADFTGANGITSGDGSITSPYKISGWVIDGGGAGDAIYVGNTTKNFTIENCVVYNANGGNFDSYHQNAGVQIYHAKATNIYIQTNTVYKNSGAGIIVTQTTTTGDVYIGIPGVGTSINRIHDNTRAGVYSSSTTNIVITYNDIWNNYNGVQFGSVTNFEITWNGLGNNSHYGVSLNGAQNGKIYSNIMYNNDGSKDYYDSSLAQAYQSGTSGVAWYDTSTNQGNFWYDWATNNDTNYDMKHNNFVIPWPYQFSGGEDPYPMKGVHHNPIYIHQDNNGPDDNSTYNIATGVVEGDGSYYRILGWEIGDGGTGYGILVENMYSSANLEISDIIAHNITTKTGATHWTREANGIAINDTDSSSYPTYNIHDVTIYGCVHNGIGISDTYIHTYIYNAWVYNNDVGIYITGDGNPTSWIDIYNSTIDSNNHWGSYIDETSTTGYNNYIYFHNDLFNQNKIGILTAAGKTDLHVSVQYSSFFENTEYALEASKNTNSQIYASYNIFYHNNGAGDTYDSSHPQVYADDNSNFTGYGNYYHDWVNDRTVSGDQYSLAGGSLKDTVLNHIDFHGHYSTWPYERYSPIYVNYTNLKDIRHTGTAYGITGYDSGTYYIIGWHNTKNYTELWNDQYGIFLYGNDETSFAVLNTLINNTGTGMYIEGANGAEVENSVVENNTDGIWLAYNQNNIIEYNRVLNNQETGMAVESSSLFTMVYGNKVYRNGGNGIYLLGASSSAWGVYVRHNMVFGNNIGLNASGTSNTSIDNNGFAWNTHYGVELRSSNGNYIYNNTFFQNNGSLDYGYYPAYRQAYDDGTNYWNDSHYGNYWIDWANNNDTNDHDTNWIVDYSYHVYGGSSYDQHPYKYRSHEVTRIDGMYDLDWDHGVVAGDGSSDYPYLMTGWRVDGNGHAYGIYIGNISGAKTYFWMDYVMVSSVSATNNNVYSSGSGIIINTFTGYAFWMDDVSSNYNYENGVDIYDVHSPLSVYSYHSFFKNNGWDGIEILHSDNVWVSSTNVSENHDAGIYAYDSQSIRVENCNEQSYKIYKNDEGILFKQVTTAYIDNNDIRENTHYGVELDSSSGIWVYKNVFYENNGSSGNGNYDSHHIQAYDDESTEYTNYWNTTTDGNCWSDWNQGTPYQLDPNYMAKDHKPGCGFVPELNTLFFAILLVALLGIAMRRRKH